MKRYIKSSLVIGKQSWKELKNKIESVVSDWLKMYNLKDEVYFLVNVTLEYVPDSFTSVADLKISIDCWYKSNNPFDELGDDISEEATKDLADYLNNVFVDTNGNNTYFNAYVRNLLGKKPSTSVDAVFPVDTEFNNI